MSAYIIEHHISVYTGKQKFQRLMAYDSHIVSDVNETADTFTFKLPKNTIFVRHTSREGEQKASSIFSIKLNDGTFYEVGQGSLIRCYISYKNNTRNHNFEDPERQMREGLDPVIRYFKIDRVELTDQGGEVICLDEAYFDFTRLNSFQKSWNNVNVYEILREIGFAQMSSDQAPNLQQVKRNAVAWDTKLSIQLGERMRPGEFLKLIVDSYDSLYAYFLNLPSDTYSYTAPDGMSIRRTERSILMIGWKFWDWEQVRLDAKNDDVFQTPGTNRGNNRMLDFLYNRQIQVTPEGVNVETGNRIPKKFSYPYKPGYLPIIHSDFTFKSDRENTLVRITSKLTNSNQLPEENFTEEQLREGANLLRKSVFPLDMRESDADNIISVNYDFEIEQETLDKMAELIYYRNINVHFEGSIQTMGIFSVRKGELIELTIEGIDEQGDIVERYFCERNDITVDSNGWKQKIMLNKAF